MISCIANHQDFDQFQVGGNHYRSQLMLRVPSRWNHSCSFVFPSLTWCHQSPIIHDYHPGQTCCPPRQRWHHQRPEKGEHGHSAEQVLPSSASPWSRYPSLFFVLWSRFPSLFFVLEQVAFFVHRLCFSFCFHQARGDYVVYSEGVRKKSRARRVAPT